MEKHVPEDLPINYDKLPEPQGVMGVGQNASTATHIAAVPVGMADQGIEPDDGFRYKSTAITNSDVPALLGLQSMIASNFVLGLRSKTMHMYTADDADAIEIRVAPNRKHLVGRLNGSGTVGPSHTTVQSVPGTLFIFRKQGANQLHR